MENLTKNIIIELRKNKSFRFTKFTESKLYEQTTIRVYFESNIINATELMSKFVGTCLVEVSDNKFYLSNEVTI